MPNVIKQIKELLALKDVKNFNYVGKDGYIFKIDESDETVYLTPDVGGTAITLPQNEILVSTDGDDNTGEISNYEKPFKSISAAVAYARNLITINPALENKIIIVVDTGDYLDELDLMFNGEIHCRQDVNIYGGVGAIFSSNEIGETFRLTGFPNIIGNAAGTIWTNNISTAALSFYGEIDTLESKLNSTFYCEELTLFIKLYDMSGQFDQFLSVNMKIEIMYYINPYSGMFAYFLGSISSTKSYIMDINIHWLDMVTRPPALFGIAVLSDISLPITSSVTAYIHIENGSTAPAQNGICFPFINTSISHKIYLSSNGLTCPSIFDGSFFGSANNKNVIVSGEFNCIYDAFYEWSGCTLKNLTLNMLNNNKGMTWTNSTPAEYDVMGSLTINTDADPKWDPLVNIEYISDYPSSGGGANTLTITQTAHGFSVGDIIGHVSSGYVLASAGLDPVPAIGMITYIIDTNNYILSLNGIISLPNEINFLKGGRYYLGNKGNAVLDNSNLFSKQALFTALDYNKIFLDIQNIFSPKKSYEPFILEMRVYYDSETLTLPFSNYHEIDVEIDWGDGTITNAITYNDAGATHQYSTAGTYEVSITGKMEGFDTINATLIKYNITNIVSWGYTKAKLLRFYGCALLESVPADIHGQLYNCEGTQMFRDCVTLYNVHKDLFKWGSERTDLSYCFQGCKNLKTVPQSLFANSTSVKDVKYLFYTSGLTEIPPGLFDNMTSIESSYRLFAYCYDLTSIPENLFQYNDNMDFSYTFQNCKGLTSLPPAPIINKNATDTLGVFYGCTGLTSLPSTMLDNLNLNSLQSMFESCTGLTTIPADLFSLCDTIVDMNNVFKDCTGLTSIPSTLFDACVNVINFEGVFFGCTGLTSIPSTLFDECVNASSFYSTFYGCTGLTSIPSTLFANNINANIFEYTFLGCTGLTSIPSTLFANNINVKRFAYLFSGCDGITSIPEDLFINNISVVEFNGVFNDMDGITVIPEDIFLNNVNVQTFTRVFSFCDGITSIPSGLFAGNVNVKKFSELFRGSDNITSIGAGLFDNNISAYDFEYVFREMDGLDGPGIPGGLFANVAATTLTGVFNSCLGMISTPDNLLDGYTGNTDNLFAGCVNLVNVTQNFSTGGSGVNSMYNTFYNLNSLSNIHPDSMNGFTNAAFYRTFWDCDGITTLPSGLFATAGTSFNETFRRCSNLTTISSGVFTNPNITSIRSVFYECTALTTIPADIFTSLTSCTSFRNCFGYSGLTSIPPTIFAHVIVDTEFEQTFSNCTSLTGPAPELWNMVPLSNDHAQCFLNCTGLSNYADIPADWK